MAKIICRSINSDGLIVGGFNNNPHLITLVYDVEFPGRAVKQYAANVFAKIVLSQVDISGFHTQELESITLHENLGNAVSSRDAYITTKREVRKCRQTTIG